MEKKKLLLKTKYIIVDNNDNTASIVYRVEKTKPVNKTVTLNNKETFNSAANRNIILDALREEKIIVTDLELKTFEGKNILAGVGKRVMTFRKLKNKKWELSNEKGFTFLETAIVAALTITLGAFLAPNLVNLHNNIVETHNTVTVTENANMDTYYSILGGE